MSSKKLGKKLGNNVEMLWQWVKDGNKLVIACEYHTCPVGLEEFYTYRV